MATIENEWHRVVFSANFPFFRKKEEPTAKHSKENSLNLDWGGPWKEIIKLRTEKSP